jgi:hypothetical protein
MPLVELLLVLAGAAAGYGVFERRKRAAADAKTAPTRAPAVDRDMPFALGDVVSRGADEAWLAGALAMSESSAPFGVVFVAPERRSHRAVVVFAPPRDEALWMDPEPAPFRGEPPSTLEIGGAIFERVARRPVKVERVGEHAPEVGERAIFSEYCGPGRAAFCAITSTGEPLAWKGERLPIDELDRMPAGDQTLRR